MLENFLVENQDIPAPYHLKKRMMKPDNFYFGIENLIEYDGKQYYPYCFINITSKNDGLENIYLRMLVKKDDWDLIPHLFIETLKAAVQEIPNFDYFITIKVTDIISYIKKFPIKEANEIFYDEFNKKYSDEQLKKMIRDAIMSEKEKSDEINKLESRLKFDYYNYIKDRGRTSFLDKKYNFVKEIVNNIETELKQYILDNFNRKYFLIKIYSITESIINWGLYFKNSEYKKSDNEYIKLVEINKIFRNLKPEIQKIFNDLNKIIFNIYILYYQIIAEDLEAKEKEKFKKDRNQLKQNFKEYINKKQITNNIYKNNSNETNTIVMNKFKELRNRKSTEPFNLEFKEYINSLKNILSNQEIKNKKFLIENLINYCKGIGLSTRVGLVREFYEEYTHTYIEYLLAIFNDNKYVYYQNKILGYFIDLRKKIDFSGIKRTRLDDTFKLNFIKDVQNIVKEFATYLSYYKRAPDVYNDPRGFEKTYQKKIDEWWNNERRKQAEADPYGYAGALHT
jgi:hypothetical protein